MQGSIKSALGGSAQLAHKSQEGRVCTKFVRSRFPFPSLRYSQKLPYSSPQSSFTASYSPMAKSCHPLPPYRYSGPPCLPSVCGVGA